MLTALAVALGPNAAAGQDPFTVAVRAADSAWAAGRFPEAKVGYLQVIGLDSTGSSRAVYRLAVLRSWDGDLAQAIPLFARYTRLEPQDEEGRIALARAYGWAGQWATAVAVYDSILSRDRTYRDAALGAAQTLAWAGRFDQALHRYDRWIAENGKDGEAALARARTLAWAGRLNTAEASYREIVADGEVLEGTKGVAIVAAWRGDLFRSEGLWRAVTTEYPKDAEAWVGLAQVLRWSGRPEEAGEALDRALIANPNNADARTQRRWVLADLAPALAPSAVVGWDSDGNQTAAMTVRATFRPWRRVSAALGATGRRAEFAEVEGRSVATRLSLRWLADRRLTLSGDLGATQTHGERATQVVDRTRAVGAVQATVRVGSRASIGGGVGRDVFDETASLMLGVTVGAPVAITW